jgi:folate-binding protein YgfZ
MGTIHQSGAEVVVHQHAHSEDTRAEFRLLTSSCGIFDLASRAKIQLTGSHRVRWLNGMITNNVRDLAAGHGVYGFVLTPQGRIQADVYAYQRGDSLLVDTDQAQLEKVLAIFRRYIIMDDVKIGELNGKLTAIGLAGPGSEDALKRAGIEFSSLQPLQFADVTGDEITMTLVRGDNPLVDSFELWVAPENVSAVRDALVAAGAGPVSSTALELLRIASGIPRYGQDIHDRDLPQETGQQRALSFTKGCYIGQEIVERIRSRGSVHRQFSGFEIDGPLPAPGTKVQADGKDAGETTSTTYLAVENGDRAVALGYIRREFAASEQELLVGDAKARLVALPFDGIVHASRVNS